MAKQKASVAITFREGVNVDDIHEAVRRVVAGFRPEGCVHCGLAGIDILIDAGDPALYEALASDEVRGLSGVLQVSVNP
jgi:hypothetical protein